MLLLDRAVATSPIYAQIMPDTTIAAASVSAPVTHAEGPMVSR